MKPPQFMFWLMPFLVLSLVCNFTTTATAQNYYPSEIGNTWVFLSADGAEQRTYTLEKPENIDNEELIVLKISTGVLGGDPSDIDRYFVSAHDGGLLLHQSVTDEGAFGIAEATFDPPVTFFPALLPVGHAWEILSETVLQLAGPATSTSAIEVVAIEDVETPAGTFKDCVKIEIRRRSVTALIVVRSTSYQWLAPDVGPVKYQDDQDIVYELESYSLVEAPTADEVPTVEDAPAAEEPAAEEPAVEEEAAEEPAAEEETPAEEVAPEMPASQMFEITLTNLTEGVHGESGQTLSPAIFAAHPAGVKLAEVGQPASELIVALAEGGDVSGLAAFAEAAGANVAIAMNADGTRRYTMPGQSTTVTVTADMVNSSLSVGSMLVSTNDAFIAAIDVPLFDEDGMPVSASLDLMAYDAGSEDNTEMASDIPGPLGLDEATDPPGSNERVPTEGGVIAAHEGIQGVGDVTEAFAWGEPTAMLTITPVDAPAEPMPEPVVEGPGFDVTLEAGLNMISIPLMPAEPYTAKSLAEMLGATAVIQLDAATQHFVGYTIADEGDGFGITGDKGYIVNTPSGGMVKFTGDAWDNQPEPEEAPAEEPVAEEEAPAEEEVVEEPAAEEEAPADDAAADAEVEADAEANSDAAPAAPALATYKNAWAFIVTSDIHGMETGTAYTLVAENLRTGTIATENVSSATRRSSAVWADLNRKSVVEAGDKLKVALYDDTNRIVSGPFQRTVTTSDIRNAFLSLQLRVGDVQPQDTLLAQNFPNPFNPETWIPYQLSESTEVKIAIYDISGRLVRSLDLGWQPTGSYMTPSSAAYWDGRNAVGERVASGIYFYTLQTSDFAATRRMVILK
ncbi:T9SS type A sorting domain-containing protein [Candidatus Poribacteria bacterium]|nr:T9SS type A sorting domain-containing protein [Candidatus Poribacteria bacterium]